MSEAPEIKMYMLTSGVPIITYETNNGDEVTWEFPSSLSVQMNPRTMKLEPGLRPLVDPGLVESNRVLPDKSKILYSLEAKEETKRWYSSMIGDIKTKLSGLVMATSIPR